MSMYRHFKGGIYEVICEALHEADQTPMIVYRDHQGTVWVRARARFFEVIEHEGVAVPRFAPLAD